jgi:DNA-binding NtrC family response regulator
MIISEMEYKLLGESIQIRELNETIKQVAPTNISVLITGESGTGKEIVANAIHHYSKRKDRPLIKVNCGAIPEGIIESELFGHQKGAFTGAIETRAGYFETADKGTIFLDEIGEMPLSTQVKILRVLESGEFMKVGGNKTLKVNVRVIAASNRDLAKEVRNKNFREDLYFRLKSIHLNIPPLRERKEDVRIFFHHFVKTFCAENKITFYGIDEEAMDYLENYSWNGNARELKNFCESIIILHPNKKLTLEDIKKYLQTELPEVDSLLPTISIKSKEKTERDFLFRALLELKSDIIDIKNTLEKHEIQNLKKDIDRDNGFYIPKEEMEHMNAEDIDREILTYLLKNNNWNVNKVSDILGQTSRNIYRKIKKFNLEKQYN